MQHNIEKWNRTSLAGYVVCGAAGENALLAAEEKIAVWETAARHAGSERLLIADAGVESVRETVCLANRAAAIGYKAALAGPPKYYRGLMNREAQMLYFRAVADQSRIPIILDNRSHAPIELAVDTLAALSEHPNIVAVRECSRDPERITGIKRAIQPGVRVLTGSAASLCPSLAAGGSGAILAFASAAPYAVIAIWEAHRMREEEAGLDLQNRIARAAGLVSDTYGIPGLKYAMDLNGYYGGPPRLPFSVPLQAARQKIAEAFRDIKG